METVYTVRSTEVQNVTDQNNTWQIMEKQKRELHRRYGLNSLGTDENAIVAQNQRGIH